MWETLALPFISETRAPTTAYGQGLMLCGCRATCRIGYQLATSGIAARAVSAVVERAATHPERWSDHAPVTVTFDL